MANSMYQLAKQYYRGTYINILKHECQNLP